MLIAWDYGGDANIFLHELLLAIIKFEKFSGEYKEFHFQFIIWAIAYGGNTFHFRTKIKAGSNHIDKFGNLSNEDKQFKNLISHDIAELSFHFIISSKLFL